MPKIRCLEKLKSLPLTIRLLIVAGPALLLVAWFLGFVAQVEHYQKVNGLGVGQIQVAAVPTEAIVSNSADIRREIAALQIMKTRGTPFLFIAGGEPGFDLDQSIREIWGPGVDVEQIKRNIVYDQTIQTTFEGAKVVKPYLEQRHVTQAIVIMSDLWLPRTALQFRSALKGIAIIPYSVPSDLVLTSLDLRMLQLFWWEFCKYAQWWLIVKFTGA